MKISNTIKELAIMAQRFTLNYKTSNLGDESCDLALRQKEKLN